MAIQRRKRRRGQPGRAQLQRSCNLRRRSMEGQLPAQLINDVLGMLTPTERAYVLWRVDHFARMHPPEPLDEETEALVRALDSPERRIEHAKDYMTELRPGSELEPWRIADAVLDLNQDQSLIMHSLLAQEVETGRIRAREIFAAVDGVSPESVVVNPTVEDGELHWRRRTSKARGSGKTITVVALTPPEDQ
jgi:hypothetical protein